MAVICVASLKGGVGKTSVAINTARAFTQRGAEVLLVDLDPAAHTTHFFRQTAKQADRAALSSLILHEGLQAAIRRTGSLLGAAEALRVRLTEDLGPSLKLLPGGELIESAMRKLAPPAVKTLIEHALRELAGHFDFIVVDTAPDFSPLTEGALSASTLAVVPVDSSIMSIWGLEQIVQRADRMADLRWCILRNMVNRQASRLQAMTGARLRENLSVKDGVPNPDELLDDETVPAEEFEGFMQLVDDYEKGKPAAHRVVSPAPAAPEKQGSPIYLLDAIIYRSEILNRLSHLGCTVFDRNESLAQADQYLQLSREIEKLVTLCEQSNLPVDEECAFGIGVGA